METLEMNGKERRRLEVLARVKRRELTLVKASALAGLSYRQAKRVYARYLAEGERADSQTFSRSNGRQGLRMLRRPMELRGTPAGK